MFSAPGKLVMIRHQLEKSCHQVTGLPLSINYSPNFKNYYISLIEFDPNRNSSKINLYPVPQKFTWEPHPSIIPLTVFHSKLN